MFEIHYYFTPLLDTLEVFDHNDWYLHPIINLRAAKAYRDATALKKNIANLNACYDRLQKITLDYYTITLHGRKYGRRFLLQLQEDLSPDALLNYTDQFRSKLLCEIGLSTADFKHFRNFSKKEMQKSLNTYYQHHFTSRPASVILTSYEILLVDDCKHQVLQTYLENLKKTA